MTFEIENIDNTHPIYLALVEVQQARSRFQLEKFVVGQHDTLEAQYKQTLLEIQKLIHTIKIVTLQLKKQTIEIDRLRSEQDEIKTIDAEIVEVEQEQTRLALIGAKKELKDLSKEEIIKRLSSRRTCRACGAPSEAGATNCSSCKGTDLYQREDDKEEVIARRLEVYEEQTAPIIAFYRNEGILLTIPAVGSVSEITEQAITALSRLA
jgi:ribosomal protein L40E